VPVPVVEVVVEVVVVEEVVVRFSQVEVVVVVVVVRFSQVEVAAAGTSRGRNIHHVLRRGQACNHLLKNTLRKARMGLPDLVLKNPLSDSIRKTINRQQRETGKQLKIFSSYILLLLILFQAFYLSFDMAWFTL
jgi:hypothetical protein